MPAIHLDPHSIYLDGDVRLALDVSSATLRRARSDGHLRYTRQGHTVIYRGQWLIDWLESSATTTAEQRQAVTR